MSATTIISQAFGEGANLYTKVLGIQNNDGESTSTTIVDTSEISSSQLRKAYYKRALQYHPDKYNSSTNSKQDVEDAKLKFQAISLAYSILSDPQKRAFYDETGEYNDDDDEDHDVNATNVEAWTTYFRGIFGTVQTKDIDMSLLNANNEYEFETPIGKNKLVFKLLTHGDEKAIDGDIKALNKLNRESSSELTTRYRYMIKSVDGKDDTKSIVDFINNRFLARDTKAFREHLKKIQPDVKMEFEYTDPASGEKEVRSIPMGVGFFWPSE